MTKEEFAATLDGREIGAEIGKTDRTEAQRNRLLVVYGASDDLCEFDGVVYDEAGIGECLIVLKGKGAPYLLSVDDEEAEVLKKFGFYDQMVAECLKVEAIWDAPGGPVWTYKTDVPHATFNIMEDGEVWCRGIVIDMKDLRT